MIRSFRTNEQAWWYLATQKVICKTFGGYMRWTNQITYTNKPRPATSIQNEYKIADIGLN